MKRADPGPALGAVPSSAPPSPRAPRDDERGRSEPVTAGARILSAAVSFGVASVAAWLLWLAGFGAASFIAYVPAVALAAFWGGLWSGAIVLLAGTAASFLLFAPQPDANRAVGAALTLAAGFAVLVSVGGLRRTLARARRSEQRYSALADASGNIIAALTPGGGWKEPQSRFEKLTGMTWPAYSDLGWLSKVHEEDRLRVAEIARNTVPPIEYEIRLWDDAKKDWRLFGLRLLTLENRTGGVRERLIVLADLHDRRMARARRELIIGDLRHRLKNFMSVVQALLRSSMPKDEPRAEAIAGVFMARMRALESAADLVTSSEWTEVEMGELVRAVLKPFTDAHPGRIRIEGPPLMVREQTAGALALACHELATNALKYGSLSNAGGTVDLTWNVKGPGDEETVTWMWLERGGPPVSPPASTGFGTRILRGAVAAERDNTVVLNYAPEGFECRLTYKRDHRKKA